MPTKSKKFLNLNSAQQQAITTTRGKVLIIAGAGSGKTSVITHRIAYLIKDKKVSPSEILGLTFTNKAAEEMRERISKLLDRKAAQEVMLSTFHSFCMYVLRREIHHLGFTKEFSLYDEKDIKRLIKHLAKQHLEIDDTSQIEPSILEAKRSGVTPDQAEMKQLLGQLEMTLRAYNAVDFDTLLTLTVELFEKHPSVLQRYQERFQYLMIDEYQDTSPVQDRLAHLLAEKHGNLCVVGDDDQSIYSWRGAKIQNILEFKADRIIKLEQNYRSTPTILQAANSVIEKNQKRHKKWLKSQKTEDGLIHIFHTNDEMEESSAVVERILHLRKEKNLRWKDVAILYRSNILSRPLEIALMGSLWKKDGEWKRGIPYEIFGGTELTERTEIKDLASYLRVIANLKDGEAMLRIINYPRRGISPKTLDHLTSINRKEQRSLWSVLLDVNSGKISTNLSSTAYRGINQFIALIEGARADFAKNSFYHALQRLIEKIQLKNQIADEVKDEKTREYKWENIMQFSLMLKDFEAGENRNLSEFLSNICLDKSHRKRKDMENDTVKLMTFHSSKGLEFPACFLVALEDHLVPHQRGVMENSLEEERRLFYVALTRAETHLTLSMARKRKIRGKNSKTNPSRFLYEIPKDLLKITKPKINR